MTVYKHIRYREEHEACYLDVNIPDGMDEFPVLIYFHGGGLEGGDTVEPFIAPLVNFGICVVSAQYRMYPNARYPEFIEDAAHSVAWTLDNIGNYGKATGIFVGGSSAGGYLTQMLCFDTHYLRDVGVDPMTIAGYIHDAGQPTAHFNVLAKERGVDRRRVIVDETSSLFHVGTSPDYPPMLFIVSDNDMSSRLEQTKLIVSVLRDFGHNDKKVALKIFHGTHCAYVKELYGTVSPLANTMAEFIWKTSKEK